MRTPADIAPVVLLARNRARFVKYTLLTVGVAMLFFITAQFGVRALNALPGEDYFYFRESARMVISGISPYTRPGLFYPLYTVLWLFTPLLAGDWTRWAWTLAPIVFLHIALGRKALVIIPFYPVLVHLRYGQVDGWLILPLMFLLRDSQRLAPVSAAVFLFKPQTAWALVVYRLAQWTREHAWHKLAFFSVAALILIAPAFLVLPEWPRAWLASIVAHPTQACQNATLWGWTCFSSIYSPLMALEGLLALGLLMRTKDKARALQLFGMIVTPILYAYDYILVAATVKTTRECLLLLAVSWLAVCIDIIAGGWGGAYALIPLVALALRADGAPFLNLFHRKSKTGLCPHV